MVAFLFRNLGDATASGGKERLNVYAAAAYVTSPASSLTVFRSHLKSHLFKFAFPQPAPEKCHLSLQRIFDVDIAAIGTFRTNAIT